VSGSAADLNIRLGRISNTAAAGAADLPRPVILRARQGQWHRRDFGRITVDSCSRLRQHSAYPVSALALWSGDDELASFVMAAHASASEPCASLVDAILAAATSAGEQTRQEEGRTAKTVQPFGARLADSLDRRSKLRRQLGLA
jgi:hypothetical protein